MKQVFRLPLLVFFVLLGLMSSAACAQNPGSLDAAAFEASLKKNPKALVIDVTTPDEYKAQHLANALNIDYYRDDFEAAVAAAAPDKNQPIYLYCFKGGRSAEAAAGLRKLGYKTVYDLKGGISGWISAGKPVSK